MLAIVGIWHVIEMMVVGLWSSVSSVWSFECDGNGHGGSPRMI